MSRLLGFLLLFSIAVSGCGAMTTKGTLQPVTDFPKPKKTGTLVYRTVRIRSSLRNLIVISGDKEETVPVGDILRSSGLFSKVTQLPAVMGSVTLSGGDFFEYKEKVLKNEFPIDADYFLDLQYTESYRNGEGYMYWGMFHFLSLGLIPITVKDPTILKATLYDGHGKKLQELNIYDETTLWAWAPLVFVNGGYIFRTIPEVQLPAQKNVLNNALADLKL